jgi:hypothetical protein
VVKARHPQHTTAIATFDVATRVSALYGAVAVSRMSPILLRRTNTDVGLADRTDRRD